MYHSFISEASLNELLWECIGRKYNMSVGNWEVREENGFCKKIWKNFSVFAIPESHWMLTLIDVKNKLYLRLMTIVSYELELVLNHDLLIDLKTETKPEIIN